MLKKLVQRFALIGALVVALASAGVAGASTTSSQSTSPDKWVSTFCGSIVTWQGALKSGTSNISKALAGATGLAALKKARSVLVFYLGKVVSATFSMKQAMVKIGSPDVKNGDKIQSTVVGAFGKLVSAFSSAKAKAAKLSTSSPVKFVAGAQGVISTIQSAPQGLSTSFAVLNVDALNKAAAKSSACKALGG